MPTWDNAEISSNHRPEISCDSNLIPKVPNFCHYLSRGRLNAHNSRTKRSIRGSCFVARIYILLPNAAIALLTDSRNSVGAASTIVSQQDSSNIFNTGTTGPCACWCRPSPVATEDTDAMLLWVHHALSKVGVDPRQDRWHHPGTTPGFG